MGIIFIGGGGDVEVLGTVTSTDQSVSPVNDGGGQADELMLIASFFHATQRGTTLLSESGWTNLLPGGDVFADKGAGGREIGLTLQAKILTGSETNDVTFFDFHSSSTNTLYTFMQRFRWTPAAFATDEVESEASDGSTGTQTKNVSGLPPPLIIVGAAVNWSLSGGSTGSVIDTTSSYDSGEIPFVGGGAGVCRLEHMLYGKGSTPANATVDIGGSNLQSLASLILKAA